ncbi:MAG: DUF4838 domain-containing protein [Lentisphaerae bacterium]|nr:DUF4838 domain-containing protein [Lentisphaerota bacterium]
MHSHTIYLFKIVCRCCMLFAGLGLAGHVSAEPFIVEDGQPQAAIVIAGEPTRMQKLAAEELQKYVKKISGAELPIGKAPSDELPVTIYVGESEFTRKLGLQTDDLDSGAYRIKSGNNWLVLMGKDTNYFMDLPGDAGPEYMSRNSDKNRAVEAWNKENGPKWSYAADNYWYYNSELDVWTTDEHGSLNAVNDFLRSLGVRWYMPGKFGEICPEMKNINLPKIDEKVSSEWKSREMIFWRNRPHQTSPEHVLWQLRLGMHIDTKVWGIHGTAQLLRPEWVKENHPEFYALYGTERALKQKNEKACYSSEGLFQSAVGFSKMMFDKYNKNVVTLTPTDAFMAICQCEKCRGKDTPERGLHGVLSDYVWDFMNRVAAEVAKTHPDKYIRCHAYNSYREAPLKIDTFHPNLKVSICRSRNSFHDPEVKEKYRTIQDAFISKLTSQKIALFEYYSSRDGVPRYYPHILAEDMQDLAGNIEGTYIEVSGGETFQSEKMPDPTMATRHLHLWLTGRLWFSPDPAGLWWTDVENVDDLLNEYYINFYGPAAKEMKAFVNYNEKYWPLSRSKVEVIDKIFELINTAHKAAGSEGIYADRIQLVIDYIEPLKVIREQLKVGRDGNPVAVFAETEEKNMKLDGRLDEEIWKETNTYDLKDVVTGRDLKYKTTFKVVWAGDSLYFGVRCEEPEMDKLLLPAKKMGDLTIFDGDEIELLLEPPSHAYYQIAIDPMGYVTDLDRPNSIIIGKTGKYKIEWESGITVAPHRGDNFWSVEVKVPALGENQGKILPDFGVSGDKPTKEAPWHFNIGRIRVGSKGCEMSMFSPTGEEGFHYMGKFAILMPE